jgi:ABC-type nitrate/sulfonate/bicarbonate transport system substrate-binding protein
MRERKGVLGVVSLLFAVLLASLLSSAAPAGLRATGATPVTIDIGYQDPSDLVLEYIAEDQGFFARESITPRYTLITTGTGVVTAGVVSGSLNGGVVALSTTVATRQAGADVQMLGGLTHSPRGLIVVSSDTTTPVATGTTFEDTLKALNGKTIGVPGLGGAPPKELDALAKTAGLPSGAFHYISVSPGAPTLAAMKAKSVDAIYSGLQLVLPAVSAGVAKLVMTSDNGPKAYSNSLIIGVMANRKLLSDNPDFARRWQRAMDSAASFYANKANQQKIADLLTTKGFSFSGIDPATFLYNIKQADSTVSRARLGDALSFIFGAGVLPSSPAVTAEQAVVPQALTSAPRVSALAVSGKAGKTLRLRIKVLDRGKNVQMQLTVLQANKAIFSKKTPVTNYTANKIYTYPWHPAKRFRGSFLVCAKTFADDGSISTRSCGRLKLR